MISHFHFVQIMNRLGYTVSTTRVERNFRLTTSFTVDGIVSIFGKPGETGRVYYFTRGQVRRVLKSIKFSK